MNRERTEALSGYYKKKKLLTVYTWPELGNLRNKAALVAYLPVCLLVSTSLCLSALFPLSAICFPLLLQALFLHHLDLLWFILVATLLVTLPTSPAPPVIGPFVHPKLPL